MNAAWETLARLIRASEEATLADLAAVALALGFAFLARRWHAQRRIRRAAGAPALSVGGWGTRGKSGTERKKGALGHALGWETFVKTTGCEAILLHSYPGVQPQEIFLYRSYDRATIWEMFEVTRMAARSGAQLYFWEAMALEPAYVRILHEDWLRSPIHTLTNTFPDHEDHQGPSGTDVARALASFVPRHGTLITSDEAFLPILADEARRAGTRMEAVAAGEAAFFPASVLRRYPYEVHPHNLALVLALARELSISPIFALREIADYLVPDLGALKVFPRAAYRGRSLEFANAMSANERQGCLSSYARIGYAEAGSTTDSGQRLVLLVNNRADRVARSWVFAEIVVMDLAAADAVVAIGTNLSGLEGYIRHALGRRVRGVRLFDRPGAEAAVARVDDELRDLAVPLTPADLRARLAAFSLPGGGRLGDRLPAEIDPAHPEEVLAGLPAELAGYVEPELARAREGWEIRAQAGRAAGGDEAARKSALARLREFISRTFMARLTLIEDPAAGGNAILHTVARVVPPGCTGRILGIQNIKGAGLGFVYRWVSYAEFEPLLRRAGELRDPASLAAALEEILAFPQPGLLEAEAMQHLAGRILAGPLGAEPAVANLAAAMRDRAARLAAEIEAAELQGRLVGSGWGARLMRLAETTLDAGDARRRLRESRRLYRDLFDGVVSHPTAAHLAHAIVERQKGGWLRKRLSQWR